MNEKVSILMPTYNNAEFIGRAIKSILHQDHQNFEIVVIDNFSEDLTEEIVNSFGDQRIIYKKIKNKGIIARSRNEAIRLSSGNWVAFLDSDDWWKKDKLSKCLAQTRLGYDFIYHRLGRAIEGKKINLSSIGRPSSNNLLRESLLCDGNIIPNSSVMVSRKIVDQIGMISEDPNKVTWEDYDYWIKVSTVTNRYKFINQILGYYWVGRNNNTNPIRTEKNIENMKICLFNQKKYPNWLLYQDAVTKYKLKDKVKANELMLKILKNKPSISLSMKSIARLFQFNLLG